MHNLEAKVLLIDDEPDILEFLEYNFSKEGYRVYTANNGLNGIASAIEHNPDLIIIDVMMPELDGVEVCRRLREMSGFEETLIVFLTARSEDFTEIACFDVGADDFVTKPIRPRVLLARVQALLKRSKLNHEQEILRFDQLSIDLDTRMVKIDGNSISIPKKQFEILLLLSSQPKKVFSREAIYTNIWGDDIIVGDRTLDVHIRKLRNKIGDHYIKTTKGVGYSFTY